MGKGDGQTRQSRQRERCHETGARAQAEQIGAVDAFVAGIRKLLAA